MLETNTSYIMDIYQTASISGSTPRTIYVKNAFCFYQRLTASTWGNISNVKKDIKRILIKGNLLDRPEVTIYYNDERSETLSFTSGGHWFLCFTVESDVNPQYHPEVDTWCEVVPSGSHADLSIDVTNGKIVVDETEYTGETSIPFIFNVTDTSLKFVADSGSTFKLQTANIILHGKGGKTYNFDTIELDDNKIINLQYAFPLGTTTEPFIVVSATAHPLSNVLINAVNLVNYTINGKTNETIEEILYGENTSTLLFVGTGNYKFTNESINALIGLVDASLYDDVESSIDEFGVVRLTFKGVKGDLEFENETHENLHMESIGSLVKNITGGTTSEETPFAYLQPYSIKITPNLTTKMYSINSISVVMNGEDITNSSVSINDNGVATILIGEVTGAVTITANVIDKNKIIVNFSATISETIYSTTKKFNIKYEVEQVNENVYRSRINNGTWHQKTLQDNEVISGLGINEVVYIPSNIEIRAFDISRYTSSDTFTLDLIIKEKVEPTSFQLELYQMNGEKTLVDKTDVLTSLGVLSGTLRESCSLMSPVITIQLDDVPKFNYVYIPNFNRYYYVTDITSVRKDLWNISLSVDVLMSFKDEIRSQTCVVARNEFDFNSLILDNQRLLEKGEETIVVDINKSDSTPFDDDAIYKNEPVTVIGIVDGTNLMPGYKQ